MLFKGYYGIEGGFNCRNIVRHIKENEEEKEKGKDRQDHDCPQQEGGWSYGEGKARGSTALTVDLNSSWTLWYMD